MTSTPNYEWTLTPERRHDLYKKLHRLWENLAKKYNTRYYWNNAAKYRKKAWGY